MSKSREFIVSVADFAYYVNDVLACTGTCNINTSLEVSMSDQEVVGGKGNKLQYLYKTGRRMNATLEAADWKLEYLALQVGSKIREELTDVYRVTECVDIVDGIGTLNFTPLGNVSVELPSGVIVTVEATGNTIDLKKYIEDDIVNATYPYNNVTKLITIDTDSTPFVGKLVLVADRHSNKSGKIGELQIIIPSFQLSGNFSLSMSADGVSSVSIEGAALAVSGEKCADGSDVYGYIKEITYGKTTVALNDIAATASATSITVGDTATISVIGLKSGMYSNIELENSDCTFVSDTPSIATVDTAGVITAVADGTTEITVKYGELEDKISITVVTA